MSARASRAGTAFVSSVMAGALLMAWPHVALAAADPAHAADSASCGDELPPPKDLPVGEKTASIVVTQEQDEDDGPRLVARVKFEGAPVEGALVAFSTPRLFGALTLGSEETSSEGLAAIPFPAGLPGNPATGEFNVTARIVKSADYRGESTLTVTGGGKLEPRSSEPPRAIWSSRADWYLLLTIPLLIGMVWSVYVFSVGQLVRVFRLRTQDAGRGGE